MSQAMPPVPAGSGEHPIALMVLTANQLDRSVEFYSQLFGWKLHRLAPDLFGGHTPAGPRVELRAEVPPDFQPMVPFLGVRDVNEALARAIAAGVAVERHPWRVEGVGERARFRDKSGTIWGLTDTRITAPPMPVPFGDAPKPPAGAICSLEMYAADGQAAGRWFGEVFGWGAAETMPQYVSFDPGAGIAGVFQSHTPGAAAMTYLYADDVNAKVGEIEAAGGKRQGDPMAMPGMATFGYFTDVSGTVMGLIGP